jgi:large subunit ribosomal protein L18
MAHSTTYKVPKRRKREGKTNYKKRLALLLSHKPRVVVRKSHSNITFQIINYLPDGDSVIVSAHSKELRAYGYKGHGGNATSGYLTGYMGGLKAVKNKMNQAVMDIGMVSPVKGSVSFAVLMGALDAGLKIPHNKQIIPPEEKFKDLKTIKKKIKGK